MNIFNSLGSNYNLRFVLTALFAQNKESYSRNLKDFLEKKYDGKALLIYKGREAIGIALEILNLPKNSSVAINGFTCFFVYKAIEEAGCIPICLDLEEKNTDLNFSPEALGKSLKENRKIKAVIIQNTLGYPTDIENIVKICKDKNIILIEDLAHSVGTVYKNGKEAGSVADFVVLSFSQDKIIDAVSGGALIIRNKKYQNHILASQDETLRLKQQFLDRFYPLFTLIIRKTYPLGLGKIYHFILKKLNLLSNPMQEGLYDFYSLPNWYCNLALDMFKNLSEQLNHRKDIAKVYAENLDKKIIQERIINNIDFSSNLRFPIFVENRVDLIKFLKKSKIFVSDIWYDDVDKSLPNAQIVSNTIVNLPTHRNVSENDARKIAQEVNLWLKSQ